MYNILQYCSIAVKLTDFDVNIIKRLGIPANRKRPILVSFVSNFKKKRKALLGNRVQYFKSGLNVILRNNGLIINGKYIRYKKKLVVGRKVSEIEETGDS